MISRSIAVALLSLSFLTGCSTTITNLTPGTLPRNGNNIYPFEVSFDTTQQSIREESVQPSVLIGAESYPMKPTPMLKGRWEAYVPIPPRTNFVYYRYKFDYLYDRIPEPGRSSRLSPTYQLEIVDE